MLQQPSKIRIPLFPISKTLELKSPSPKLLNTHSFLELKLLLRSPRRSLQPNSTNFIPIANSNLKIFPKLIAKLKDMQFGREHEANQGSLSSRNHLLQWSQWQLLDSLLPTGGFAHSCGLEAAIQSRLVSNQDDLKSYIIQVLENTGSLLLPFVYAATKSPDVETWSRLNKWLEATLTNEISRKASASQGSALIRVASHVFAEIPSLKKMRDDHLGSGMVSFHHAPIFGHICGLLGFDTGTCQRAYMFMTMRDVISAATRLNLIGPLGASVLQHEIAAVGEEMAERWMDRDVGDACQTAPLVDIVQGCHGYLFSRMFCS